MIRCFRSSKLVLVCGFVLTLGLSAVALFCRPEVELWLNIITIILILALGFVVSRLVANMVATNTNSKLLGILHMELDPERFIAAYGDVPAKFPTGSHYNTVTSAYLAMGYAAKGDYATAKATLCTSPLPTRSEKNDLALQVLIHDGLCEFALLSGDTEQAKSELETLRAILQRAAVLNPDLNRNYRNTEFFYQQWLHVLAGETTDEKKLNGLLAHTAVKLRRLEMQTVMARSYEYRKQNGLAKDMYQTVINESGKTHFAREAKEALEELTGRMGK